MNSEQRKMPKIELENLILRIKTYILSLIVAGESLNRILHEIEEKGRIYVSGYWETIRYAHGRMGQSRTGTDGNRRRSKRSNRCSHPTERKGQRNQFAVFSVRHSI